MRPFIIFILFTSLIGCSKILGRMFDEDEKTDFSISSYGISKNTIIIQIPKTDHTPIKSLSGAGEYFYGYFIYRSEVSPYEGYTLIGFDSRPDYNNSYTEDYVTGKITNGVEGSLSGDSSPAVFVDTCTGGKIYYYRVLVGYKKYNGVSWEGELKEKGISGWTGSLCPIDVLYQP